MCRPASTPGSQSGGGDLQEGQLHGLTLLSARANFRAASTRIVVWFGDAPQARSESIGGVETLTSFDCCAAGRRRAGDCGAGEQWRRRRTGRHGHWRQAAITRTRRAAFSPPAATGAGHQRAIIIGLTNLPVEVAMAQQLRRNDGRRYHHNVCSRPARRSRPATAPSSPRRSACRPPPCRARRTASDFRVAERPADEGRRGGCHSGNQDHPRVGDVPGPLRPLRAGANPVRRTRAPCRRGTREERPEFRTGFTANCSPRTMCRLSRRCRSATARARSAPTCSRPAIR